MSQPFSVIRKQEIGYNESGQTVRSEETYIKLSLALIGFLRTMQGARLSAFLRLALNEAEISLGRSNGLSLVNLMDDSGYSDRHVLRAIRFLTEKNFAVELPDRGPHDEKLYRVSGYAWFGEHRAMPTASNRGKNAGGDMDVRGVTPSRSRYVRSKTDSNKSTSPENAAQRILHAAGWFSIARDLPQFDDEEHARALAQAIRENRMRAQDPASYVRSCVMLNQNWGRPAAKEPVYVGTSNLTRADFTEFEWRRLTAVNRREVIANERGCELNEVEGDPE